MAENGKEETDRNSEIMEWNVELEVQLFYAMRGHKPVGVNRYFQMACIFQKLTESTQKDISSKQIWDHLDTMYDMQALHESEIIPFPNDDMDFTLPEVEYKKLMTKVDERPKEVVKPKEETVKVKEKEEVPVKEKPVKGVKTEKEKEEVPVKEKLTKGVKTEKEKEEVPIKEKPAKGVKTEKEKEKIVPEEKEVPVAPPKPPVIKKKPKELRDLEKAADISLMRGIKRTRQQEQNSEPSSPVIHHKRRRQI